MSPTTAYVVPAATIVFLALISAPTSAVGTPDAGPDAAAEALPPARDLTIVQKIRADPDLSSCTTYPLRSMIADKSINEEFLQCSDVAVPDGDSVLFSDGEKDAVVPFCLANFFSFEVLCKAPPASVASANKGSAPLFKDTNLEFKPSLEFCNKLGSTLVQFDCEAVKQKVPGASVARCNAFNEARTTLLNNCPTVCAIGGINGFEAQCKHLFLTSVLVKNTMAELEATVGGHVKKGSANDAAKTKVIVAPPLVSSSTKKTAVLQKPDAGADGKVVEQPEAIGRGDETKEENKKDDVGNADKGYEAEKPWRMPTEAPRSKEDQITNEGDAPGWRPPQAPRNPLPPQSPVFVDHLSKMGSGLDNQANYFSYFVVIAVLCIVFYLVFHNKQKILALILEGRKGRGNGRRRPSRTSAQYRKLDNHLEEAGGIDGNGADNAASEDTTEKLEKKEDSTLS